MARRSVLRIEIDGIEALNASLNPRKTLNAIVYSLNRALTTARKAVSDTVRREYNLKAKDIKRPIFAAKATRHRLMASMWIGQRKRYGSHYFPSRKTGSGVSMRIRKSGTTEFTKAFIWNRGGKKIVLQRKTDSAKPLREPVREMNIRTASIVRPYANKIKRDFYANFERILLREIQRRSGNL